MLAPDRVDEVAEALLAAEREVWARTTSTMRSATTAEVLRNASDAAGLPVEEALHDKAIAQLSRALGADDACTRGCAAGAGTR